jgi:hypothetical protein
MWNGGGHSASSHSDETRRLSIELAIAQHTGGAAPYTTYDYDPEYRRGMALQQRPAMQPHYQQEAEEYRRHPSDHAQAGSSSDHSDDPQESRKRPAPDSDDDEDDDDDADSVTKAAPPPPPRGKPEIMASKLAAAARAQEKLDEGEKDEDDEVVAQPLDDSMEVDANAEATAVVSEAPTPAPAPKKKKKKSPTPKKPKAATSSAIPTMEDPVTPITDVEYENLEALFVQFCRVPLLAEFSRPVALLHPEVSEIYWHSHFNRLNRYLTRCFFLAFCYSS